MTKIRLLKIHGDNAVGDTLEMDDATAALLISNGIGEDTDLTKAIDKELEDARNALSDGATNRVLATNRIQVVDKPVYSKGALGLGEFCFDVAARARGHIPARLNQHNLQSRAAYGGTYMSDVADYGDDLIPDDFLKEIFSIEHGYGEIYNRCRKMSVQGNNLVIPYLIEADRDTGAGKRHGGVTATPGLTAGWQKTESRPKVDKLNIPLTDIPVLCPVTDALLEDNAINLGQFLMRLMGEAIAYEVEKNIIRSTTGVHFTEGLINSASSIGQGRAAWGAIAWADICNIYANIHPPLRKNMVWLISPSAEAALLQLQSTSGFPIYLGGTQFPSGVAPGPNTILGKPVFISEHASVLGATADIIACNLSDYIIAEKARGPQFASSIHLRFDFNITTFRLVMRVGGAPWWQTTLTLENGNEQVSWASYLSDTLTDKYTF